MGLVCFYSQRCVGLLIDNWIKSKPASAQGYLLLLRGELYLALFLSYLIFGACVESELWEHPGCTSIPSAWCQTFARQRQPRVSPGEALAGASLRCSCHEHPPKRDHPAVCQHHGVSLSSHPRGPPLPANTQVSAPESGSSPFCSKFSPPGPSSGTAWTKDWWGWGWTGAAPHDHIHSKVTGMSVKCSQAKGKKTQLGPDRDEQGGLWAGVDAFEAHACAYVAGHGCPHWCTRMCWLRVYVCTSPDLTSKILLVTPAAQQPCPGHPNSTDLFRCSAPPSAAP